MLIGAHVSSAGGVQKAITRGEALDISYIQTFLSAPQSYVINDIPEEKLNLFLQIKESSSIEKCYAHAIYLLNFASESPQNINLSKQNLIKTLSLSASLKFNGVVIHLGSTRESTEMGVKKVAEGIKEVLENTSPLSFLIMENSAGAGNCIGSNFNHIAEILNHNKGNNRLKVCIDTQHAFAAGYNLRDNPAKVIDNIFSTFGKDKIEVIHLNDSKTEFNSKKDRHENIGEGRIGYASLRSFCSDARFDDVPMMLEVPGFTGTGPDSRNLEIVKSFKNDQ